MIKLINICKTINGQKILTNISVQFPDTGLFVICGPSGCGKTTLLNILAGLDNEYDGLFVIDGKNNKNNEERLAYINQKNMVLADETIQSNVEISAHFANKKIHCSEMNSLLKYLSLEKINPKQRTRLLSGGENQRVSVVMGLAKKSKVLLCDEITSKLDHKNATIVIDKLKEISKSRLVILVTHDLELVKNKYTGIITLEDGKLISFHAKKTQGNVKLSNSSYKKLSIDKIFKITLHKILTKKKRVGLCVSLLTVGLVAFSLSIFIAKTLKQNLDDAFSSFINKDEIVMQHKLKNNKKELVDIGYEEYKDIYQKYSDYFYSIGVDYKTNIDSLLDVNECKIYCENRNLSMINLSIDDINNYECISGNYDNDVLTLILDKTDLRNLCMFLKLNDYDVRRVNEHLKKHSVLITFKLENSDWNYKDTITFKIQEIREGIETKIAHTNPLFNEYIYEELMRFKDIDNVVEKIPWALEKQYYLRAYNSKKFLDYSFTDDFFKKYYPALYKDHIKFYEYNGLCINQNDIAINILNKVKTRNIKVSTGGSYLILPESSISGFSNDFLLTNSEALLDETIEFNSSVEKNKSVKYPSDVYLGNITNLSAKNINFSSDLSNVIGNKPMNSNEIIISSKFAEELFNYNWENKEVYVGYLKNKVTNGNVIRNVFAKSKLKVIGIVENDKYLIYQDYHWLINFFRDNMGIDNTNLIVDSVQFLLNESKMIDDCLMDLNKNEMFEYINTSENISSTIEDTINIVQIILLCFSFFTIFLSLIMLTLILYLFKKENERDFAAIYALGGRHIDVMNYKYCYALIIIISAFIVSTLFLSMFFIVFKYVNIMFFSYTLKEIAAIYLYLITFVAIICVLLRLIFLILCKKKQNITKIMHFYE